MGTPMTGCDAAVDFGGLYDAMCYRFRFVDEGEVIDISNFEDADCCRQYLAGIRNAGATIEAHLDAGAEQPEFGDTGALTLTVGTGYTISGTVLVTRSEVEQERTGHAVVSFDVVFQGCPSVSASS